MGSFKNTVVDRKVDGSGDLVVWCMWDVRMNLRLLAFTVRPLYIALTTISSTCKGRSKLQNRGTGKIEIDTWAWMNMEHEYGSSSNS